jgi:hypothetical protein
MTIPEGVPPRQLRVQASLRELSPPTVGRAEPDPETRGRRPGGRPSNAERGLSSQSSSLSTGRPRTVVHVAGHRKAIRGHRWISCSLLCWADSLLVLGRGAGDADVVAVWVGNDELP